MEMRIATCQCESFQVAASGEPDIVGICHCLACQRRSGVPWTHNAYFRKSMVRVSGDFRVYTRKGEEGRVLNNHFCPTCGTTVCWTLDLRPDHYGVAVGCFNDPSFPAPNGSTWEDRKHAWVMLPDGIKHFARGRPVASA